MQRPVQRANGAGRLTTHQHMPHKDFHSYMPDKHSYGHSGDAVVGHSGGHSGAGGYIAPDSQFGVVLDRLSDVLADSRNRFPEVVIPKFSGDPLDFASFVRSFDSRIASRTSDEGERLYHLEQFTVGTARDIVRSCMHMLWSWLIKRLEGDSSVGLVISFCCLRPTSERRNLGLLFATMT